MKNLLLPFAFLMLVISSCTNQKNLSYLEDDIYLTSAELKQKGIVNSNKSNTTNPTTSSSDGISEEEYLEEEYFDEDYADKRAISPYSPIYDPFLGPPSPWTRPGWNSALSYGYNPWMGSNLGVGIGYTWGNGGFNNPYNPYNQWMNPYNSLNNPLMGGMNNPYGWGMPMGFANQPMFWGGDQQQNYRLVTPRASLNNGYRSNAVDRQFIRSASQGKDYKRSKVTRTYTNPSNPTQPKVNPNISTTPSRTQERQRAREVVRPDDDWKRKTNTTPARSTSPSRNSWSPPARSTSPTRATPSRNRRY